MPWRCSRPQRRAGDSVQGSALSRPSQPTSPAHPQSVSAPAPCQWDPPRFHVKPPRWDPIPQYGTLADGAPLTAPHRACAWDSGQGGVGPEAPASRRRPRPLAVGAPEAAGLEAGGSAGAPGGIAPGRRFPIPQPGRRRSPALRFCLSVEGKKRLHRAKNTRPRARVHMRRRNTARPQALALTAIACRHRLGVCRGAYAGGPACWAPSD